MRTLKVTATLGGTGEETVTEDSDAGSESEEMGATDVQITSIYFAHCKL